MKTIVFFLVAMLFSFSSISAQSTQSIYDIKINTLTGDQEINLSDFKGKKIMFVNVASKCGFTPQYEELQKLHEEYKDKLVVIGVPCNQFGGQEPGSAQQIAEFCSLTYGVKFLMTEKINVKGDNKHSLYQWLTQKKLNGKKNSAVRWNFQKYIVDENGELVDFFYSMTSPTSSKITKLL